MYSLLVIFITGFPYFIYPWGVIPDYTAAKATYLTLFAFALWVVYIYKQLPAFNRQNKLRPATPFADSPSSRHPAQPAEQAKTGRIPDFITFRPADWAMLAYIVLIWGSALLSTDLHTSIYGNQYRKEGLIALFAYVSLYFFCSRLANPTNYTRLIRAFVFSSVPVSIYGILQHFHLDFLPRSIFYAHTERSFALFDNPNFFGSYLVLALMLTITVFLSAQNLRTRALVLLFTAIHFTALIYTMTRSAWLGFAFAFFILSLFILLKQRTLLPQWSVLALTLVLLFTVLNMSEFNTLAKRAETIVADTNKAFAGNPHAGANRWYIWKTAFPILNDRPWFGSGPDTFAAVFSQQAAKTTDEAPANLQNIVVDKAHNEYLQIAITTGIPSLFFYCLALALIIYALLKRIRTAAPADSRILYCGLLACIAGYALQAFFNVSVVTVAPFFWCTLGLAYGGSSSSLIPAPASARPATD